MTTRTLAMFVTGLVASGSLALFAQQAPSPAETTQDPQTKVVMEFYRPGITPEERIGLIHRDYQQHNQDYVKYARDKKISNYEAFAQIRRQQGLDQAAAAARAREVAAARGPITPPQTPVGNALHILYREGDYVVRIAQRWTQDPASPQSFYESFWWDTFEVRDGKLYQHWDAGVIAAPASRTSATPPLPVASTSTVPVVWPPAHVVPAPGCAATPEQVAANKAVARRFFEVNGAERLALLDETYIQHNPVFRRYAVQNRISDYETVKRAIAGTAIGAPVAAAAAGPQPPAGNPFERVIGACDVVTLIHKVYRQDPTMPAGNFYDSYTWDMFRVRNGKLVEHWDGATVPAVATAGTN